MMTMSKVPKFKKPKTKKRNLKKITTTWADDDTDVALRTDESQNISTTTTGEIDPVTSSNVILSSDAAQSSNLPKNGVSDDDSETETQTSSNSTTLVKIQSIKKQRRLKSFQRRVIKSKNNNRAGAKGDGGDNADDDDVKKEELAKEANKDLKERLEGTFATNKRVGYRGGGGGDDDDDDIEDGDRGVLQRKHKLAMEQYIQNQMNGEQSVKVSDEGSSSGVVIQDQSALYAQLIREAAMTATDGGVSSTSQTNTSATDVSGTGSGKNITSVGGTQEGDVGAGGAMLGGTGIAEVVLPVEERIQTAKNTELAASQLNRRWNASRRMDDGSGREQDGMVLGEGSGKDYLKNYLPTNFGQGPGKKRQPPSSSPCTSQLLEPPSNRPRTVPTTMNSSHESGAVMNRDPKEFPPYSASSAGKNIRSEDVSHIGASYAHNYHLHTNEWISNKKREQQVEIDAINKEKEEQEGTGLNRMRVGFEVKRGLQSGSSSGNRDAASIKKDGNQHNGGFRGGRGIEGSGRGSARDNQVWKNFMHKEKDRALKR